MSNTHRQLVVLVHGFAAGPWLMINLERRLAAVGYRVLNFGYQSLFGSLERHAARLRAKLLGIDDEIETIHFVAHSMGTIVTRMVLAPGDLPRRGRIVLIAPPNRGTPVARWVGRLLDPICPGVGQLSDAADSFVCRLASPEGMDIGVIAARYDYMVPLANTKLDCMTDHITLPGLHSSLLFQKDAARQIEHFLKQGRFSHPKPRATGEMETR